MKRANKKGIGYVRKRKDTGKYVIEYYNRLGVRCRDNNRQKSE